MSSSTINQLTGSEQESIFEFKVYRKRWLLLFIFSCYSLLNSFQWIQYSIIENIVSKYYNVESMAIDWTSMIFMVVFVPLIFPAMNFLDKKGLRWSIILGTCGTAAGACIKIASVHPDLFWVTFVGQTLVAMSQVFMLSVPPTLAAIWFGAKEVSTACSIAVFGNMFGIAMGFLVPPLLVKNHDNTDDIGSELSIMFYYTAGFSTAVFLAAVFFFQDRPPTPPSAQQAQQKENASRNADGFVNLVKRLFGNRSFVLVLLAFSINQGVTNSVSTLLNQLLLTYFEGGEEFAGIVGLVSITSGMVGGVLLGVLQDRSHRFKQITLAAFTMSLVGMSTFTLALELKSSVAIYITVAILGCFLGGYMPIAYDFAAELTYPEPEGMTAGILILPAQISGALFTLGYGEMLRSVGPLWANVTLCCTLLVGSVIHVVIRPDLRRQAVCRASVQDSIPSYNAT
ncbi:choline/ethanolamine transporter flvcr2b-like [Periplaneta americana]|uniref:choline/ethanolamine transporter flvcr2b-like n=1 Tax=Periplaneta americana TaxID=6978 RepID=UPI0037E7B446